MSVDAGWGGESKCVSVHHHLLVVHCTFVLEIQPRASHELGKHTELHLTPFLLKMRRLAVILTLQLQSAEYLAFQMLSLLCTLKITLIFISWVRVF